MGNSIKFLIAIALIFSLQFSLFAQEKQAAEPKKVEWVVIVNASNSIESLDRNKLRRLLLKEVVFWENSLKVVPIVLEEEDRAFSAFVSDILNMKEGQYSRHWIEQKFTRGLTRPKSGNANSIIRLIGVLKGAISVIPKKIWDEAERVSVKSISLEEVQLKP